MQKTETLYRQRSDKKIQIESSKSSPGDIKIGEFWWYYDGVNIGHEISKDGKFLRACLVIENALGNGLCMILPLTTKFHTHMQDYYIDIDCELYNIKRKSYGIINQIKQIDKKRLVQPLTYRKMKTYKVRGILKRFMIFLFTKKLPI